MYKLDKMTEIHYDPEADAILIRPPMDVLLSDGWTETIDVDMSIIIDVGDTNNIQYIEILWASELLRTTKEKLEEQGVPEIKYDYGNETHILDIFFEGIGGVRAVWNEKEAYTMYMRADRVFVAK